MNFRKKFLGKIVSYIIAASILISTPLSAFAMPVSKKLNQTLAISEIATTQGATGYQQVTTSTNFNDHIPGTWLGDNIKSVKVESGELKLGLSVVALTWHKESVYVADGSLEVKMKTSSADGRVGLYLKPYDNDLGMRIAYDLDGKWIWEIGDKYGTITADGPELAADQLYKIKVEFEGKHIKLSVDDVVIGEKMIDEMPTGLKQWGVAKWFSDAVVTVEEVNFSGLGLKEAPVSPEEHTIYFKDYEDGKTGNWTGGSPTIVEEGGNKVLKLKGNFGRIMDNDSVSIKNGTIKMRVKATKTGQLGFGFRGLAANNMVEVSNDGGRWVAEYSGKWPDFFDTPALRPNEWEDIMITFNEKVITMYINDKMVAQKEFPDVPVREGKFGIRSWGDKEVYIDNLLYTSEVLEPAKTVKYENNFEHGVVGNWTAGTSKVVKDGNNSVLKLDFSNNAVSVNNDTPEINNGSLKLKVKTTNGDNFGFGFRAKTNDEFQGIRYVDSSWKVVAGTESTDYSAKAKLKANAWNNVLLNFKGKNVTMFINGEDYGTVEAANLTDAKGKLAIMAGADSTVYVDDIVYTEETLALDPNETVGRKEYKDAYDTPTSIDWSNATPVQKDGVLSFELGAGKMAINNDTPNVLNGVYQAQFKNINSGLGVVFGYVDTNEYVAIYHKGNGTWVTNVNGTEKTIKIDGPVMMAGETGLLNVEVVEGTATLRYNNKLVAEFKVNPLKKGQVGIINASEESAKVELDMMSSYETFIYSPDYRAGEPSWSGTTATLVDGKLKLNPPAVAIALDKDSPKVTNQLIEFGFNTSAVGDMTGGRYGFVFRGIDAQDYAAVTYDVNGKWHVNKTGANVATFPVNFPMEANTDYDIKIKVVDQGVQLWIDGKSLGTVNASIDVKPGSFGIKSWWGQKNMTFSNLKVTEIADYVPAELETVEKNIESEKLNVVLDDKFPRIIRYEWKDSNKVLKGQEDKIYGLSVNNEVYYPEVTIVENTGKEITYKLSMPEIDTTVTMKYTVKDNIVEFNVTEIKEDGDFRVMKLEIPNHGLITTNSIMDDATFSTVKTDGRWYTGSSLPEEIVDNLADMKPSEGAQGVTIGLLSGNGLAAAIENNVMTGGAKVMVEKNQLPLLNEVKMANGIWTYREFIKDADKPGIKEHEDLPWSKIVITDNLNSEKKVDWQDAAIAYRDIMTTIFGAEQLKESMMYISFNFASQANSPFLRDLDTGKVLYNYTDGFGQMVMSKGYQGEGHDDAIPDYDKIGIRQGGVKDFNYLIEEGKKYNLNIGVHINATEYHLDAFETVLDNLNQPLSGGWDWIDPSYYVDQTKDVTSGELERRFTDLKKVAPGLNFAYIDVYTGNSWNSRKLLETLEDLELIAGTEFAGPNEPGVTFTHWGPDLGYPNQGNTSKVMRFIKNDLDLFTGKSLLKGQKIPGVTTWGDSRPDMKEGVYVFYNEVLPTKYMQHFGITRWDTDRVEFEGDVVSQRDNGKIKLTKDGKLIAVWTDKGETTDPNERHTSPTLGLIPWNPITEDKLYHWNPEGGSTTWELPNSWSDVASIDVYELSDTSKDKVQILKPVDGKITINVPANTPYVLYKDGEIPDVAADWGEGSSILDNGFDSGEFDVWDKSSTADSTEHIRIIRDEGTQNQGRSPWNNYLKIGDKDAILTQEIDGLTAGEDHTVSVWSKVSPDREAGLEVEVDGKTYKATLTDSEEVHFSSFKYVGTTYQELRVKFNVPEDVTTATVRLTANDGPGIVEFDDARIWEHPTKSVEEFDDYLVYEDFENVARGWGIFEYGYRGSRRTHLSDKDLSPDSKQHMNWVRDGAYSLKSNEDQNQQVLKTVQTTLKLEPNTTYQMGMLHSIESGGSYNIAVKSKSGDIVLNEKLENVSNAAGGTDYTAEFTTGDYDDYYVAITQNSDSKGQRTIIIDNFWVMDQTQKVSVTGVQLDAKTKELKQEEEFTLNAIVLPKEATNKKVIWASSDEKVATVQNGVVTAIAEGKAIITVTTEEGAFTDACTVTVTKEAVEAKMSVELTGNNTVKSGEKLDLIVSLDEITEPVYAQDITITYDITKFTLDSIKGLGLNQIVEQKEDEGSIRILGAVVDEQGEVGNLEGLIGKSEIFKVSFLANETDKATSGTIRVKADAGTVANDTSELVEAGTVEKDVGIITKDSPEEPGIGDKTALNSAIASAKTLVENAIVGTAPGNYPQSEKDILSGAIKIAEEIVKTDASQAKLDQALATLNQAIDTFKASKIKEVTVTINDLKSMLKHYRVRKEDASWNEAKKHDVISDGVIDIKDFVYIAKRILTFKK